MTLAGFLSQMLPVEVSVWRTQFQALFSAAALVAWMDHHDALVASGASRSEFFRGARQEFQVCCA